MIKVSIIIPVYKVPSDYLRSCLDSLVAQSMQGCEFIVVSDGAAEAECTICEEYTQKDIRFKFFRREHNGVSAARNYGIEQARGEYITFVDADDWIDPETCDLIYKYAKENDSELTFWDLFFEEASLEIEQTAFGNNDIHLLSPKDFSLFQESIINAAQRKKLIPALTVCKLIKRDILIKNDILYNNQLSRGEDRVFNYNITKCVRRISYLHRSLYHYRIHNESTEKTYHKREFKEILIFIQELNQISNQLYIGKAANEAVNCFYGCVYKLYKLDIPAKQLYQELHFIKEQIKAEPFRTFIQHADYSNRSKQECLEMFFMKKGISVLFSFRIMKTMFFRYLKSL